MLLITKINISRINQLDERHGSNYDFAYHKIFSKFSKSLRWGGGRNFYKENLFPLKIILKEGYF